MTATIPTLNDLGIGHRKASLETLMLGDGGTATSWRVDALCAQTDPEVFFPERGDSGARAKRICGECPVRLQCLDNAMASDEHFGIWGGLTEKERRRARSSARKQP